MLYSMTLVKGARALRSSNPTTKTSFTKFQTIKGHARIHTTKTPKFDKAKSQTHDSGNKSSSTWKDFRDTLFSVLGAGGAITTGIVLNTILANALQPQLDAAYEVRANQAPLYYVHGN